MPIHDIWFDLCVGKIKTDEDGSRTYTVLLSPLRSRVTLTFPATRISKWVEDELVRTLRVQVAAVNRRLDEKTQ